MMAGGKLDNVPGDPAALKEVEAFLTSRAVTRAVHRRRYAGQADRKECSGNTMKISPTYFRTDPSI